MLDSDFAPGLRNICECSKVIQASAKLKLRLVRLRVRYYNILFDVEIVVGNSAAVVLEHFVEVVTFVKAVEK